MRNPRKPDPSGPAALTRTRSPFYCIWDLESGNSLGTYESRDDALGTARSLIDANGLSYADALDVSVEDEDGNVEHVANGDVLLRLTGFARHAETH